MTRKDSYVLPRMDDFIDSFRTAQFFSTLDDPAKYWQILGAVGDRDKTAFTSHRRLYQLKRLTFDFVTARILFKYL
jgi:hypothetical protein